MICRNTLLEELDVAGNVKNLPFLNQDLSAFNIILEIVHSFSCPLYIGLMHRLNGLFWHEALIQWIMTIDKNLTCGSSSQVFSIPAL